MNGAGLASGRIGGKFLAYFKRLALALDLDPVALLKETGIDRRHLEDLGLTLPVPAAYELVESAALSSGIEDFGLHLGEAYGLPDLGPVGLLMREELTVRDALQTMISLRNLHSDLDSTYMHLEEGETPIFRTDIIRKDKTLFRQSTDFIMALNVHILRSLLGEEWAPASVCFTHSRPKPSTRFNRFFRCPIHFEHEFNGIVLRQRELDRKMPPSSSVIRWQMDRFLQAIDIVPGNVCVHRAAQIIAIALPRGQVNAQATARCLGVDRRTLHRRLARAGVNYSKLVENIRKNLAAQYIVGSDRPLLDVASMLGFSSSSAFIRWFRRSFDCTPKAWRKAQRTFHDAAR